MSLGTGATRDLKTIFDNAKLLTTTIQFQNRQSLAQFAHWKQF